VSTAEAAEVAELAGLLREVMRWYRDATKQDEVILSRNLSHDAFCDAYLNGEVTAAGAERTDGGDAWHDLAGIIARAEVALSTTRKAVRARAAKDRRRKA